MNNRVFLKTTHVRRTFVFAVVLLAVSLIGSLLTSCGNKDHGPPDGGGLDLDDPIGLVLDSSLSTGEISPESAEIFLNSFDKDSITRAFVFFNGGTATGMSYSVNRSNQEETLEEILDYLFSSDLPYSLTEREYGPANYGYYVTFFGPGDAQSTTIFVNDYRTIRFDGMFFECNRQNDAVYDDNAVYGELKRIVKEQQNRQKIDAIVTEEYPAPFSDNGNVLLTMDKTVYHDWEPIDVLNYREKNLSFDTFVKTDENAALCIFCDGKWYSTVFTQGTDDPDYVLQPGEEREMEYSIGWKGQTFFLPRGTYRLVKSYYLSDICRTETYFCEFTVEE